MFCKKCGAQIRLNAKFCAKCGTPAPVARPVEPTEEVKTLLTREGSRTVTPVAPAPAAPEAKEDPKLIINMAETRASSSNGQFDEWFTEAGDLD